MKAFSSLKRLGRYIKPYKVSFILVFLLSLQLALTRHCRMCPDCLQQRSVGILQRESR